MAEFYSATTTATRSRFCGPILRRVLELLEDTQDLILNDMYYYADIGLSLELVIKTLEAYSDEMWYPSHAYMVSEGVLTK